MVMFEMSTGAAWRPLMHDIREIPGYSIAWVFFISWMILCRYLLIPLQTSIICDTFTELRQMEQHTVSYDIIIIFTKEWANFQLRWQTKDEQHNFMKLVHIPEFLTILPPPVTFEYAAEIEKFITEQLVIRPDGTVHVLELYDALLRRVYGRSAINLIPPNVIKQHARLLKAYFPDIAQSIGGGQASNDAVDAKLAELEILKRKVICVPDDSEYWG